MLRVKNTLSVTVLLAALAASSCQNLSTLVTGEKFILAPEGSPRVELELTVDPQDSLFEVFGNVEVEDELRSSMSDLVLSMADVGMRFYPILDEQYGRNDEHPPYVMNVSLSDLVLESKNRLIEEEGAEPRIETTISSLSCMATVSIEKRREGAPPLVVAHSQGSGAIAVKTRSDEDSTRTMYPAERLVKDGPVPEVSRKDVLAAIEEAVTDALRGTVRAVDRDLALRRF
jgi:hypothetical protein